MADRLEMETAGDKKVAAMMAQAAGSGPQTGGAGSISERLLGLSDMYAKAGSPTKAAEYAQHAAQAQSHEATARAAEVRQKLQAFQLQDTQIGMVTKLLGGVQDEASWKDANNAYEKETGQRSPLADVPYDPKVVKLLQDSTETAYQRQQLAIRETALKATLADTASKISSRATRDNVAIERLRVSQQRDLREAKAGGKDVGAPGKAEVEAADRLLGDSGLKWNDRDSAAFSIAAEAKSLRRKNPGISADEAIRQAHLSAKQAGDIVPGEPSRIPFIGKPGASKFVTPQPLPESRDPKDLVAGNHYTNKAGLVKVWDGKVFKDVGKITPKKLGASPISSSPDVTDEEDDDE
jgi:hypothetical protein